MKLLMGAAVFLVAGGKHNLPWLVSAQENDGGTTNISTSPENSVNYHITYLHVLLLGL
jgi:hypothetical protein